MSESTKVVPMADDPTLSDQDSALLRRWEAQQAIASQSRSLGESVRLALAAAIIGRELPPGTQLREERMASVFNVSRTPVREALAALENAELLHRDGRGSLRVATITADQILDVYAVRRGLEGLAASLLAESAPPRVIIELRELNRAFERAIELGDLDALVRANNEFHEAIGRATGNRMLIRFLDEVASWVKRFPTTTLSQPDRAAASVLEHERMIDAIERRDVAEAGRLAQEHMRVAEEIRVRMVLEDKAVNAISS